jgi:crotonobetainyl-CoA:carnitine CoA-transferase CaiB-like acyl-CoA transferase
MTTALNKLRVLDMSRILAGPWAGQLLGDYGADVVKVERPGNGDDTRQWGPPWLGSESAYFLCANRNKRSLTVDIATAGGQQVIRELAGKADVLLENFKVGTLKRYELDPDDLLAANPRLIICSISAFGQSGSRATQPGYDAMIQATGGLMSITGPADEEGGGPQKVGVAIADIMAGMYATTAILAALHAREQTGRGQHIDVPLYDSQIAWLANQSMNFLVGGAIPGRMGTAHPNLVPYQAFATSDGNLMLAVGNDRQFATCAECLGRAELAKDDKFATSSNTPPPTGWMYLHKRVFRPAQSMMWAKYSRMSMHASDSLFVTSRMQQVTRFPRSQTRFHLRVHRSHMYRRHRAAERLRNLVTFPDCLYYQHGPSNSYQRGSQGRSLRDSWTTGQSRTGTRETRLRDHFAEYR